MIFVCFIFFFYRWHRRWNGFGRWSARNLRRWPAGRWRRWTTTPSAAASVWRRSRWSSAWSARRRCCCCWPSSPCGAAVAASASSAAPRRPAPRPPRPPLRPSVSRHFFFCCLFLFCFVFFCLLFFLSSVARNDKVTSSTSELNGLRSVFRCCTPSRNKDSSWCDDVYLSIGVYKRGLYTAKSKVISSILHTLASQPDLIRFGMRKRIDCNLWCGSIPTKRRTHWNVSHNRKMVFKDAMKEIERKRESKQ